MRIQLASSILIVYAILNPHQVILNLLISRLISLLYLAPPLQIPLPFNVILKLLDPLSSFPGHARRLLQPCFYPSPEALLHLATTHGRYNYIDEIEGEEAAKKDEEEGSSLSCLCQSRGQVGEARKEVANA